MIRMRVQGEVVDAVLTHAVDAAATSHVLEVHREVGEVLEGLLTQGESQSLSTVRRDTHRVDIALKLKSTQKRSTRKA
tara:strand:+ start:1476 stop:1709 length:234 start_codon:yes stop_codon:yes gene_type:complete